MVAAGIKIGPPDQLLICNDRNETQTACDIRLIRRSMHPRGAFFALLKTKKNRSELSENNPRLFFFILFIHNDVGVKRYFDPFDTRLLRALHSRKQACISFLTF